MTDLLICGALALGLAALEYALLPRDKDDARGPAAWLGVLLFFSFALSWLWLAGPLAPRSFPPAPDPRAVFHRAALCVIFGAAAYGIATRRLAWMAEGAILGLMASCIGWFATRWLAIAHAWEMMSWFSGTLVASTMPLLAAAALAVLCLARHHPDFRDVRATFVVVLLAGWAGSAELALWRLHAAYGFGPRDLKAAAGVPSAEQAPMVGMAWLHPSTSTAAGYFVEVRRASIDGLDAEGESLLKLYSYLKQRDYGGVFAQEALKDLRGGWLLWWDADRALEAAMLDRPGREHPDYLTALALLRAGPLTVERFQKLRALSEIGHERRAGFEDVNRSQLIFEAFSAAYARFGDEEGARDWLFKVDNLWPIYEKKVEASPIEGFHDGMVSGSLEISDRKPTTMLVGLFLVSISTGETVATSTPTLSQSDFPDESGRFAFRDLGAGTYFLAVEGAADAFRGAITGSPGYIQVLPGTPSVHVDPIRIAPVINR